MNPSVSVIMPVYNGEKYISNALDSLLAQSFDDWELVIVNDGSTDSSAKKIEPYFELANIRYIYQDNRGVAAALNRGIEFSSGDFIALLDQDDIYLPDKLSLQISLMREHPDIALAHGDIKLIDGEGREIIPLVPWITDASGYCFATLFVSNRIAAPTVMLRKTHLSVTGVFDESLNYGLDYDLWLRISHRFPIGYINRTLALYRRHDANMSASKNDILRYEGALKALRKALEMFPDTVIQVGEDQVTSRLKWLEEQILLLLAGNEEPPLEHPR